MRAGKLDTTIEIWRPSLVDDGMGSIVPGPPEKVAELRAQPVEMSTEQFVRAWGTSFDRLAIFRIRHIDGITLADRVKAGGVMHRIIEIKPLGRRRGLELRCTTAGA